MSEDCKHPLDTVESPERPSKVSKTSKEEEEEEEPMSQNPRLQRYLVAIEYIGTRFSGSQQQLNCRTVVGALQVGLFKPFCLYVQMVI